MSNIGEVQQNVIVTKQMVTTARNHFLQDFKRHTRTLLVGLAESQNAETPGGGSTPEEIALSISWHNAGVEAIRILIGEAVFIPVSDSYYRPKSRCQITKGSGNKYASSLHLETFDIGNLILPVCDELALRPSGV